MADATESNIIYQEKIVNNLYIELSDNDKKNNTDRAEKLIDSIKFPL